MFCFKFEPLLKKIICNTLSSDDLFYLNSSNNFALKFSIQICNLNIHRKQSPFLQTTSGVPVSLGNFPEIGSVLLLNVGYSVSELV